MAAIVVFPFYAFACMNFPVDNIFCPFYPYPRKAFSVFAEILPIRGLEPTCEPAVEVRGQHSSRMGRNIYEAR